MAIEILEKDPELKNAEHQSIKTHLSTQKKTAVNWSKIS
jgi:hypothetical protein